MKIFRDPVHGDIFLSNELIELLDTREMQRLRGIKQLGTAFFVYPGAVHTRFEHSLGTCFLAGELLSILKEFGASVSKREELTIKAAALLHDVGHIPFGHTIEDERRLFSRHDSPERFRHFLTGKGELAKVLAKNKLTEAVLAFFCGEAAEPWRRELISGTFCADLLDYLARDAFFCGLPHKYDKRIMRSLRICDGHLYLDCQKNGIVREDFVSELINLLRLRYFLTERVFFHHTKIASGVMISKLLERALRFNVRLEELYNLSDERFLYFLELRAGSDPAVKKLLSDLASRRLYKQAYVLTGHIGPENRERLISRYHKDAAARLETEGELAAAIKANPEDVAIYCPSGSMQLKEAEVSVKVGVDAPESLAALELPEVKTLLDTPKNLWRFYVFASPEISGKIKRLARLCEERFGTENHLSDLQSSQLYMLL